MSYRIPIDAIKTRKSIRNFAADKPIESEKRETLLQFIKDIAVPNIRIEWIDGDLSAVKLGTYGMISGARSFLVGIVNNKKDETVREFGRLFELAVLKAAELGLGTCWMAGTYSVKDFKKQISLSKDESIVIVSPIGYAASTLRKRDTLLKVLTQNHKRKPWNKIFFEENWQTPLDETSAGTLKEIIEMVRIGPSSSNKQPWRIVKKANTLHLYSHKKTAQQFRGVDYGVNDTGIAMAHVEVAAEALELRGDWSYDEDPELMNSDMKFIAAWTLSQ